MKKKIFLLIFSIVFVGSMASVAAEGIMVHDVGLNSAQDASYLSVYEDTLVTDLVFSSTADETILNAAIENAGRMGINAWYSYEIDSTEEFENIDISLVPEEVYGIELDFITETGLVPNGHAAEVRTMITSKLQEIRRTAGDMKISAKVPGQYVTAYDNGLDVYTWSSENLVDMLLISPYHHGVETDMSLDVWRGIINSNIEIAGVIGTYMNTPATEDRMLTLENAAALSNVYLSSGADKIYLDDFEYQDSLLTYEPNWETDFHKKSAADTLLRECGNIESLKTMGKRFIVTNSASVGNHSSSQNYDPLPLVNSGVYFSALRIKTGNIADTSSVKLLIGCSREDGMQINSTDITVFMNRNKLTYEFTADYTYLKSNLSNGKVLVYSVDTSILNDINQVIELKSNITSSDGTHVPITVDYVEMRESPAEDVFIYRNMSEGQGNAVVDSEIGRNVINAGADTSLNYELDLENEGIYALSLCYKSDTAVNITVNGSTYILPAQEEYMAYGFASLSLKSGKNEITFINDADISYNYFVLYKADTYLTKNGEEILTFENGQIVANAKLSGLLKGQELVLIVALYDGNKLEKVYYDKQIIDTDNYMMKLPVDLGENNNCSMRVFLWNGIAEVKPYASVKIY